MRKKLRTPVIDVAALAVEVRTGTHLKHLGEEGRRLAQEVVTLEFITQGAAPDHPGIPEMAEAVWVQLLRNEWVKSLPEGCVVKTEIFTIKKP